MRAFRDVKSDQYTKYKYRASDSVLISDHALRFFCVQKLLSLGIHVFHHIMKFSKYQRLDIMVLGI